MARLNATWRAVKTTKWVKKTTKSDSFVKIFNR